MSGKQLLISLIVLFVFFSFKSSQEARKPGREAPSPGDSLNPAVGTNGMVSTAHPKLRSSREETQLILLWLINGGTLSVQPRRWAIHLAVA
jgi:hypothetical protein